MARKVVCNRCTADWPQQGHMCKISPTAKPTVLEDHSEMLELIRADIRELKLRLAPWLAAGPLDQLPWNKDAKAKRVRAADSYVEQHNKDGE